MCPVSLEKKISKKTKAIIPVHFAGSSCEMKKIIKISKKYNIPLIEDCAQAHGTKYHGKMVGSFGKIACFSFYATKHMTTGEGGILCTDDKKVHDFCKSFRNHGMSDRDTHFRLGYNFRMSELNAAIGNVQLKKLRKMNSLRVKNSKYILKNLAKKQNQRSWFKIQEPLEHIYHTYFWCPIRIVSKKISIDEVKKKLLYKGIEIRSRYKYPLYRQKVFQNFVPKKKQNFKLENAETLSGKIFGLPNHYRLKKKELDYIIKALGVSLSDKVKIIAEAGIIIMVTIKKYLILSILQKLKCRFCKVSIIVNYFINKKFKILILKKFIIDLKN